MTGMKLTGVIAASILAPLAIAYAIIFAMVHATLPDPSEQPDIHLYNITTQGSIVSFNVGDRVEIKPGNRYGWYHLLRTTRNALVWEESLTLPIAPATWKHERLIRVSSDGRTAYTAGHGEIAEWKSRGWDGFFDHICFVETIAYGNSWVVLDGDPTGEYRYAVTIGKKTVNLTLHVTE